MSNLNYFLDIASSPRLYPKESHSGGEEVSKPSDCHFLKLPGELRNRIYSLIAEPVEFAIAKNPENARRPRQSTAIALLQTCKQIRAEAWGYIAGCRKNAPIYWSDYRTRYEVMWNRCGEFHYDATSAKIEVALWKHESVFEYVRDLDLKGNAGRLLIEELPRHRKYFCYFTAGFSYSWCREKENEMDKLVKKLNKALHNVESITVFVEPHLVDRIRAGEEYLMNYFTGAGSFPKLKSVLIRTETGLEVVAQRGGELRKVA